MARASVDHQHRGLHSAGAEQVQGLLAGLTERGAGPAYLTHELPRPVGFAGTRQASAPAPGVRLELGPLGRCPDLSPEPPPWKMVPSSALSWLFVGRCTTRRSGVPVCK